MLVDFESEWFKLYSSAILASDPELARQHAQRALSCIQSKLLVSSLARDEREAMLAARRYLLLMDDMDLPKAS